MPPREACRQVLLRLVHDVGKYVARTARNLGNSPTLPLSAPLLGMLLADLYEGKQGKRPSVRFAELRQQIATPELAKPLDEISALLAEIDRFENAVRSADSNAIVCVTDLAQRIDSRLRALLVPSPSELPRHRKRGPR